MARFYDGIKSFKGYMRRVHNAMLYDWADLSSKERAKFAAREATKRERREETRDAEHG